MNPEEQFIPLALVDDHEVLRSAMAHLLNSIPGYRVVVEARHGLEFVRAVNQGVQVAVAVVDLQMPMMDGFETIAWIKANCPGTRALALTFDPHEAAQVRAMRAGACGFLRKNITKQGFLDALNQVAVLGRYHHPMELAQAEQLRALHERDRHAAVGQLTEREMEYIRLVCDEDEFTNEQLAERMGVHRRTVDGYRECVHEKCGVKTKAGLVVFAYKWGLVQ